MNFSQPKLYCIHIINSDNVQRFAPQCIVLLEYKFELSEYTYKYIIVTCGHCFRNKFRIQKYNTKSLFKHYIYFNLILILSYRSFRLSSIIFVGQTELTFFTYFYLKKSAY